MVKLSNQSFDVEDAERTSQFYDTIHIHYEKLGIFSEENPYVTSYGLLRDRITRLNLDEKIRNGVVLDAGCGAWQKGVRILHQFHPRRIEAVDFNERSLAHCKDDPQENTTYSKQDLADLHFEDETFDLIICEGVLHHTLDPQKTLDELIRVLKPGGCLTLGVYCWRFPYSFFSWLLKNTLRHAIDVSKFLSMSGRNKIMLIFADFIFVPIEHYMNEKQLLAYLSSKRCRVILNDMMSWPLPVLKSRSKHVYQLTGLLYKHIFVMKEAEN
jgi:ubiquinone/menaquinone biosynthesis C-methylase UbiE